MDAKEWLDRYLNGRTDGWEYILTSGGGYDIDTLDDRKLEKAIEKYQDAFSKLDKLLAEHGYHSG